MASVFSLCQSVLTGSMMSLIVVPVLQRVRLALHWAGLEVKHSEWEYWMRYELVADVEEW